jgi:putative transposase
LPSVEEALHAAMTAKCRALGCPPIAVGGVEDHVHLLVSLDPAMNVAKLVKDVKGSSSHLMTHGLAQGSQFRWQSGYGAFSLRHDDVPTVRRYIAQQKEHHRQHPQPLLGADGALTPPAFLVPTPVHALCGAPGQSAGLRLCSLGFQSQASGLVGSRSR